MRLLRSVKAEFKIIMPDGTEYGELVIASKDSDGELRSKKRMFRMPVGKMRDHYKPYIENLKSGDVAQIPFDHFERHQLRQAVSAWACSNWGSGNVRTCITDEHVEVLRV
mgnify:CR=1 FL=1